MRRASRRLRDEHHRSAPVASGSDPPGWFAQLIARNEAPIWGGEGRTDRHEHARKHDSVPGEPQDERARLAREPPPGQEVERQDNLGALSDGGERPSKAAEGQRLRRGDNDGAHR